MKPLGCLLFIVSARSHRIPIHPDPSEYQMFIAGSFGRVSSILYRLFNTFIFFFFFRKRGAKIYPYTRSFFPLIALRGVLKFKRIFLRVNACAYDKKNVELISRQRVHISLVRCIRGIFAVVWSVDRNGSLRIIFILYRYTFGLTLLLSV